MTIEMKCLVCRNPDRRRLIELGWNAGMTPLAIANVLDLKGLTSRTILRHLKEHADGIPNERAVDVEPATPTRERVAELQRLQLDEVERRIALAKQRAAELNSFIDADIAAGVEGADRLPYHDWSEFYDVLDKGNQAAIGSILKTQALHDRRESAKEGVKLGIFEIMSRGGNAPKKLVGEAPKALPDGVIEGEIVEEDEDD